MHPFAKYDGAGNDFVLLTASALGTADPPELARRICPRETGVGVDGLVLVSPGDGRRSTLRFFNPDGSEFATCGNGSRCAARYLVDEGLAEGPSVPLATDDGPIDARVDEEGVTLAYTLRVRALGTHRVELVGRERRGALLDVGTPHFVVPLNELPEGPIEEACRPIRGHPAFGAEGANVDLVALESPSRAQIRTYERGVEAETLACGSGCMAAALALRADGRGAESVAFRVRSGATLTVTLRGDAARGALPGREGGTVPVELAGPAVRRFEGRFPRAGG